MRNVLARAAFACAILFSLASYGSAATYQINFSSLMSGVPSPLTGSFNIDFDPTVAYGDTTTGIVQNSLNVAVGSTIGFNYLLAGGGVLDIGGIQGGVSNVAFGFDDLWIRIANFTTNPVLQIVWHTTATQQLSVQTTGLTVSVSEVTGVTPVPIPGALLLLGSALAGFFGFSRLRERFTGVTASFARA